MGNANVPYDDARFAVEQCIITDRSGALNGTVGATELMRYTFKKNVALTAAKIRCAVGGTEASKRKILIGKSVGGTGTTSQLGTQALGTQANNTIVDFSVTGNFDADDDIVISHLGTGAAVYDVQLQLFYRERFVNA